MTQAASRYEPARPDSLRFVPSPSEPPSADGASPPGRGRTARGPGGGQTGQSPARAYNALLIARVQQACGDHKAGELAEMMGLHPETVRRYLRGQKPAAEFLAGLCRVLGVSPAWLLLGEGPMLARRKS